MNLAEEILQRFNLHYESNIINAGAPGLNAYEISLFLTRAHKEIIYNYYNGTSKGESLDISEKLKSLLSSYTKTSTITDFIPADSLEEKYKYSYVILPADCWFLIRESAKSATKVLTVKPIKHDEFYVSINNPFKAPNDDKIWRVDENVEDVLNISRSVLLVSTLTISSYLCTYIVMPQPIIVDNLDAILPNLEIEGLKQITIPKQLERNQWLVELIISRAVELATSDYRENTLQSQLLLNNRVE